jgi:hypothetical protein
MVDVCREAAAAAMVNASRRSHAIHEGNRARRGKRTANARHAEPLFIHLANVPPSEAAALVRAILAECHDASIPLKVVRVPADVWQELAATKGEILRPAGTRVELSDELHARLEFWPRSPANSA